MTTGVVAALVCGLAVLLWPRSPTTGPRAGQSSGPLRPVVLDRSPALARSGVRRASRAARGRWDGWRRWPRWRRRTRGSRWGRSSRGSGWGRRGRWGRWGRAGEPDATHAALDLLDALTPALRAGLTPAAALRAVRAASPTSSVASHARGGQLVGDLLDAADRGAPLAPVWWAHAERLGSPDLASSDLALVAAAWSLCDSLGSPVAATVGTVAGLVRRRRDVRRRVEVAVAGPRATMRLLLGLPLVGPLLALGVGVSPTQLYAGPAGVAALSVGVLLAAVGWWWSRRLMRAVFREKVFGVPDG